MSIAIYARVPWRLLVVALMLGACAAAGLGSSSASAAETAPGHSLAGVRPAACPPCIVAPLTPAPNSTVMPDAKGKVTISATAQLANPYTKFFFIIDDTTTIDTAQIQITGPADKTQPTGTYEATLTPGQHTVVVQVDDTMTAPAASFQWSFTVTAAAPTAIPTKASGGGGSTGGSGGGGSSSGDSSSSGFFAPRTLSIILFSIAGVGLLVVVFIAGMWYGGRRWLSKNP